MAAPEVHATTDVEAYAAAALAFLDADPCARSVLRSIVDRARAGGTSWTAPPAFWWVTVDGRTEGAAHWTPPFGLAASSMPAEAIEPLVAAVLARSNNLSLDMPFVVGPTGTAEALAAEWARATRSAYRLHHRLLLHELRSLIEPRRPPGRPRVATLSDVDLLVSWYDAFAKETEVTANADTRASTLRVIEEETLQIWEDGEPVSFVNRSLPAAGVARIGPVYTPPEHRGRGYARALTAHSSQQALDSGAKRCMLYTDADNPVSNRIYADIGYVPTGEHVEFRFDHPLSL